MIGLDIGAGKNRKPGYLALDVQKTEGVTDILADAAHLPFRNESWDRLNCSDVLEHFPRDQVVPVLLEWLRVLKSKGVMTIKTPDIEALAIAYCNHNIDGAEFARKLYGNSNSISWNAHKSGQDRITMQSLITSVGAKATITQGLGYDWSNMIAVVRK